MYCGDDWRIKIYIYSSPWPERRECQRRRITSSFYGVIKTQEGNTKLPQHKPQSYRPERNDNKSTAITKEDLNPQFNALHFKEATMLKKVSKDK